MEPKLPAYEVTFYSRKDLEAGEAFAEICHVYAEDPANAMKLATLYDPDRLTTYARPIRKPQGMPELASCPKVIRQMIQFFWGFKPKFIN